MPASNVWDVEWLDRNALRKYPLSDTADGADETGQFYLPDDFLVDARISTYATTDPTGFHVASLVVHSYGVVLALGYRGSTFASVLIPSSHNRYDTYWFSSPVANGSVTVGSIENVASQAGVVKFIQQSARFCPSVVTPFAGGVSAIYIENADGTLIGPITGDITIKGGDNVHITVSGNEVQISAVCFDDYTECDCPDNTINDPAKDSRLVRSINGVYPDNSGNIDIVGYNCLQVAPLAEGKLLFNDICTKPSGGCMELEAIKASLVSLSNDVKRLNAVAEYLQSAIGRILTTVTLARSRL